MFALGQVPALVPAPVLEVEQVLESIQVLMAPVEAKPEQFCPPSPSQVLLQWLPSLLSAASEYDQLPRNPVSKAKKEGRFHSHRYTLVSVRREGPLTVSS